MTTTTIHDVKNIEIETINKFENPKFFSRDITVIDDKGNKTILTLFSDLRENLNLISKLD